MIRTKGAAGTGDVVQAVKHHRTIANEIAALKGMDERQLIAFEGKERVQLELVKEILALGPQFLLALLVLVLVLVSFFFLLMLACVHA